MAKDTIATETQISTTNMDIYGYSYEHINIVNSFSKTNAFDTIRVHWGLDVLFALLFVSKSMTKLEVMLKHRTAMNRTAVNRGRKHLQCCS